MNAKLLNSLLILPTANLKKTADFYATKLKFRAVEYLAASEPHICLYRDSVEIVLVKSDLAVIQPNRIVHGRGYDGYFTTLDVKAFYDEFCKNDVKIAKPLNVTDYGNQEFVIEDIDGRWIAIGLKTNPPCP